MLVRLCLPIFEAPPNRRREQWHAANGVVEGRGFRFVQLLEQVHSRGLEIKLRLRVWRKRRITANGINERLPRGKREWKLSQRCHVISQFVLNWPTALVFPPRPQGSR